MAELKAIPRDILLAILADSAVSVNKAEQDNLTFRGWDYANHGGVIMLSSTFDDPITNSDIVLAACDEVLRSEPKPWTPQPDETVMYWSGIFDEWREGSVIREWRGDILVSDSEHATIVPCDFDEVLPESERQHAEEVNLCSKARKEVGPYADDFTINELVINGWRPKD